MKINGIQSNNQPQFKARLITNRFFHEGIMTELERKARNIGTHRDLIELHYEDPITEAKSYFFDETINEVSEGFTAMFRKNGKYNRADKMQTKIFANDMLELDSLEADYAVDYINRLDAKY